MILKIDINNKSKSPVSKDFIFQVAKKTLDDPVLEFLKNKTVSLSVALVGALEIKSLNKKFRKVDRATDVLSFAEYESLAKIKKEKNSEIFLGELVLCYNDIASYAKQEKIKIRRELAEVISHGILHLISFKHGKEMFKIQKEVAENF